MGWNTSKGWNTRMGWNNGHGSHEGVPHCNHPKPEPKPTPPIPDPGGGPIDPATGLRKWFNPPRTPADNTTNLPASVTYDTVMRALDLLGIPRAPGIQSVTVEQGKVTVVQFRRDAGGELVIAGDEIATVTTSIGIVYPPN